MSEIERPIELGQVVEANLERAYWEFDADRKAKDAPTERDAFKGHCRALIRETNALLLADLNLLRKKVAELEKPMPQTIWCPICGARHVDEGEFETKSHHTHSCQHCGLTWRPAVRATVGVKFLPGFKDPDPPAPF